MCVFMIIQEEGDLLDMTKPNRNGKSIAVEAPESWELPGSSISAANSRHVVIVMDGMKEFITEPLEWALKNVISTGCTVTLLGAMPWLNIPLSTKTWLDVWPVEFEDLKERSEWISDAKYLKLRAVIDICRKYGVVPQKEVVMGYPLRLLTVEKISSLSATWVVFDRHHRKHREFFAEKIPCNMVMMNDSGEVDIIRGRSQLIDNGEFTPGESPVSFVPTPELMLFGGNSQGESIVYDVCETGFNRNLVFVSRVLNISPETQDEIAGRTSRTVRSGCV